MPTVEEAKVTVWQTDEGRWIAGLPYGSTICDFDDEAQALEAGVGHLLREGCTRSRAQAQQQAAEIAGRRNGPICAALRRLRRRHKAALHLRLGLPSGADSLEAVVRWTSGRQAVPVCWIDRIPNLYGSG